MALFRQEGCGGAAVRFLVTPVHGRQLHSAVECFAFGHNAKNQDKKTGVRQERGR